MKQGKQRKAGEMRTMLSRGGGDAAGPETSRHVSALRKSQIPGGGFVWRGRTRQTSVQWWEAAPSLVCRLGRFVRSGA